MDAFLKIKFNNLTIKDQVIVQTVENIFIVNLNFNAKHNKTDMELK